MCHVSFLLLILNFNIGSVRRKRFHAVAPGWHRRAPVLCAGIYPMAVSSPSNTVRASFASLSSASLQVSLLILAGFQCVQSPAGPLIVFGAAARAPWMA